MNEATYNQLNTLRSAKVQQIDSYFSNISNQVQGFCPVIVLLLMR